MDNASQTMEPRRTRTKLWNTTLTYGVSDRLDLALNLPYGQRCTVEPAITEKTTSQGDVSLALKWRFYETDSGWSLGLKPVLTFSTGNETTGWGNGRSTINLNGLVLWQQSRWDWMLTAGVTYNANKIEARTKLWNMSSALKIKVLDKWFGVLDVGAYRQTDKNISRNPAFAVAGVIYSATDHVDFDIGYKKGLNSAEVDQSFGVGITYRF